MNYRLHPDAALEHEEQVAYYEERRAGLGLRYHAATIGAIRKACESPRGFRIARPPDIRKLPLRGFPFAVVYREVNFMVQVLAVTHHRREPNYWVQRI